MEFRKKNWTSILNNWIASIALILTTLLLGLSFVTPSINANALTQSEITNDYNIYFVAAKTKVRSANGLDKTLQKEKPTGNVAPEFYTYQYKYNNHTDTKLYYGTSGEIFSASNTSSIQTNNTLYTKYDENETKFNRNDGFIPYGVNYFDNVDGQKEKLFYDNANENDFVLINNYNNLSADKDFNVENFYLSFGTPYIDDTSTTPLYSLRVEGRLYSQGTTSHILSLNSPRQTTFKDSDENNKNAHYWSQYFDLKNLKGQETNDPTSRTYDIEHQQGKYIITFHFIRYDKDLRPISDSKEETFTFSFYLLDGTDYSQYPTIGNTHSIKSEAGKVTEHFYNFTSDLPYIKYDPTKYNISYSRANNTTSENVTSSFESKNYALRDGKSMPLGIITYRNNTRVIKQVYILTHSDTYELDGKQISLVEYLYLSATNPTSTENYPTNYSKFQESIDNDIIDFEYKMTVIKEYDKVNTYTINTYKTSSFVDYKLLTDTNTSIETLKNNSNYKKTESYEIKVVVDTNQNNQQYNIKDLMSGSSNSVTIASLGNAPTTKEEELSLSDLQSGIILNRATIDLITDTLEIDETTTKYVLTTNINDDGTSNYTLVKTYKFRNNVSGIWEDKVENIKLPTDIVGEVTIRDTIDNNISIMYTVVSGTPSNSISDIEFGLLNNFPVTVGSTTNFEQLEEILDMSKINLKYSYELTLGELGIYNINYAYICSAINESGVQNYYINATNGTGSNSTNFTTPVDFASLILSEEPNNKTPETTQLNYVASGYIGEDTAGQIKLNGITFQYNKSNNTISIDGQVRNLDNNKETPNWEKLSPFNIDAKIKIESLNGKNLLSVIYNIGEQTNNTTEIIETNITGYRQYITHITTTEYKTNLTSSAIPNDSADWQDLKEILMAIESYNELSNGSYVNIVKETSNKDSVQGKDKLHIFGSIAYFNKTDAYTDNGYAKLEQVDNQRNLLYLSDVTKYRTNLLNGSITKASDFKGLIAKGLTKENIIVTDVTPIMWNNFSTLLYLDKKSQSYIFRYTDYSFDEDGKIIYGTTEPLQSTYHKDIYCQFDGLYEIVVVYTYDELGTSKTFYQFFTFIIDNSSPTLNIEVETEDENEQLVYKPFGLNKYTNKNVRLTWEVPTYFKHDVYVEINKSYYDSTSSSYNFISFYQQNNITTTSGNTGYVDKISKMGTFKYEPTGRDYYYVELKVQEGADPNYNLNGNYKIIVHYNTSGKSTFTEEFVIDKQDISGLNIKAVVQDTEGGYSINKGIELNSQIVNNDFTFRYNPKASGAAIFVYYDKIDLQSTEDYDKIINVNSDQNVFGITTTFNVNGDKISVGTPYSYNYTHLTSEYHVDSNNLLTSNNSSLFLFRMQDEAGNECRYVVFYDTTTPRFLTAPEPDKLTHIINDTTRVVWGDYKAIKVSTENPLVIDDINKKVDNYSKEKSDTSKLEMILRYMNTNTTFNNLKVQLIDGNYYILVPITETQIQDYEYNNKLALSATTKDYYFFPVNPIETEGSINYITLPKYNADGSIQVSDGSIVNIKYEVVANSITTSSILDFYNNPVVRYISLSYYNDATKQTTSTISGAIGEGTYIYSVLDAIGNKSSGLLWMNLDKTQTLAFGIFDYSDNLKKAQALNFEDTPYSASKMFISSLSSSNEDSIPEFEVTYKHYAYDASLYEDYSVTNIELVTNGKETSYQLTMENKNDSSITKTITVPYTDEDGNLSPMHSYPYSLEGNGITKDIYDEGYSYLNGDDSRKYSLAVNTTTDTNRQKIVTEEGLYIFKREYTDPNLTEAQLGTDSRIRYLVYYVDRGGIINITTNNSVANKLYNVGSAIGFTLGSNYIDKDQQKHIDAKTIQNNQTSASTNSNANYQSLDLFATNKIQVEFSMAYDKHNFDYFILNNKETYDNLITQKYGKDSQLHTILTNTLFNERKFRDSIYKVELNLRVGDINVEGTTIINEKEGYYSPNAKDAYLKGTPMIDNNARRSNNFNFYYDAGNNKYVIEINDQAGYAKFDDEGITLIDKNYLANKLAITFDISHNAPEGDIYGKYYGRHNYDNNSTNDSNLSLPTDSNGQYAILSKYLQEGQLEPLSDGEQEVTHSQNGDYIKLKSTNNETMIFTFSITEDEYQAKIDPNNIQVYKGSTLIFDRRNGECYDTPLVKASRQRKSFIINEINGITYYAIIIFDNNLDDILDEDEKQNYSDFRLLDKKDNNDSETYTIHINYVGNKDDYQGEDDLGNSLSFFNTTYEIIVDRIKPMYNLTKLMTLDKYVYNTISTQVTAENYENVFNTYYKDVYNSTYDEDQDFYRSDLEKYFFSIDCRQNTAFKFESVSKLDNSKGIYIRPVNKNEYRFSITPDDYRAYYNATYLQGHPQFTPSSATAISNETYDPAVELTENKYYYIPFSYDNTGDGSTLSTNFLKEQKILRDNKYYEVIESDETGNYRVYAIYVPDQSSNLIEYTYQLNSNISSEQTITFNSNNTPTQDSKGMELRFTKMRLKDNFLRANLEISTNKFTHNIDVILNPVNLTVTVTNRTTGTIMWTYAVDSKDKDGYANTTTFMEAINNTLDYYYGLINNKTHSYYSQFGYDVDIDIVDRTGISVKNEKILYNYEIDYTVAGSTLSPIFIDNSANFTMRLEGQKGSTHLTDIRVYKFNKSWLQINVDNSASPKIFDLTDEELKKPIDYIFTRGVYKFVFVDNFNRTNEFYHEFGISSSQTGGSLSFSSNNTTLSDGYTYSANPIEYSFDSSVYTIFIKFIGNKTDEFTNELVTIKDSENYIIYNSSNSYNADYLKNTYGITIITAGNTTTISFAGVHDLSKYHIKAILASTSDNYTWNAELKNDGDNETNTDIIVHDKKIAIYTAIQDINIRNLSGTTLPMGERLNLTEDFELVTVWKSGVSEKYDLNSRIILTRTYNDNGTIRTSTTSVKSGTIISQPGDYTAYVINDLGVTSRTISFTRGEGEISMYAVYAVNSGNNSEMKLSPSSLVTTVQTKDSENKDVNKVLFTYFITDDYFSFKDKSDNTVITRDNIDGYKNDLTLSNNIVMDLSKTKYIDVRVNSNLSIEAEIYSIDFDGDYPYIQYRIYSDTKTGDEENSSYTYRFIKIVFITANETEFTKVNVYNPDEHNVNLAQNNSLITSTADSLRLEFAFFDNESDTTSRKVPLGDTIFVDRYYNGVFAETTVLSMSDENDIPSFLTNINTVGLHEFVIRDLAGRVHSFYGSNKLRIYLINQILFTVNDENPINNQIFNGNVDIDIVFSLSGLELYNTRSLSVKVTKNGTDTNIDGSNGSFTLAGAGYYTITMTAVTLLNENNSIQITSIYNCLIVDTEIANRTFSISKGAGFTINKLIKIVGNDKQDLTHTYQQSMPDTSSDLLLWITANEHNNSIFDITLGYYEAISNINRTFNFRVWINNESPIILSNIASGTSTKNKIEINYNPGIIYSQIGKGYITLNDQVIAEINEDSLSFVDTLTIEKKGIYWFKIFSEDGTLVSAYKFTKNDPVNKMTKFILIGAAIAIIVVVIIFFLLRRKGKYR